MDRKAKFNEKFQLELVDFRNLASVKEVIRKI